MQVILISGLSGSGKSVALKALEDSGYFCVDNLPATLIQALTTQFRGIEEKIAISVDARTAQTIETLPHVVRDMRMKDMDCRVIFLEANNDALARRFSEVRRPHPLGARFNGIAECIEEERRLLTDIAEIAHRLDTSEVSPSVLRAWIKDLLNIDRTRLTLCFESFGFKHGIPLDADFVFDVRFLPNPFYDPKLRPLTGHDPEVVAFLRGDLNVGHLIDDVSSFLMRWLPSFVRDNRSALTVAIGCTGGQHRSVYIVNELAERFGTQQQILVRHRELKTA